MSTTLDTFFNPRSVAVVGASDDATRIGGRTIYNLRRGGFAGTIYPINPGRDIVQNLPAYSAIGDIPGEVDCAVIALPAEHVIAAVEQCEAKGVSHLVIFSAGFSEAGDDGIARQARLAEITARSGMRVIGPNCLGAFNAANGTWLSFTTQFQAPVAGPTVGMISQSGGSAAHILRLARDRQIALGKFLTTGNEADVDLGEGLLSLAEDHETCVIALYIEGIRNGANLIRGLEAARDARKPVIALKVGRTSAGAEAAASHTASLAGEDRIYDAIFAEFGVVRANSAEQLLDFAYAAALTADRLPSGNRLGVVTISGGMGAQIADAASDGGLVLPQVRLDTQDQLKAMCPPGSSRNPVDLTALVSTEPHLLADSMRLMLETGDYDMMLAFFGVYADVPALCEVFLEDLAELRRQHPAAIVALCIVCSDEVRTRFAEAGYLVFEEPARATAALSALRKFATAFAGGGQPSPRHEMPRIAPGARLDERSAKLLLESIGVASPRECVVPSADEVVARATEMGFPLALKVVSADILHKSDVGGVKLGLADQASVAAAAAIMAAEVPKACPTAEIEGYLLSEMVPPGVELIVATRCDPVFGPIVMVGLGGVTAELFSDVCIRRAPLSPAGALAALRQLKGFPLLDGYRGAPPCDIPAAVAAISAMSQLGAANRDTVEVIEINPLRVFPAGAGAKALDAVIITHPITGDSHE